MMEETLATDLGWWTNHDKRRSATEQLRSQKWLSISVLSPEDDREKNFARLRKGYASLRKSFRSQVLTQGNKKDSQRDDCKTDARQSSLVNQISSRLLRRGTTQQLSLNKSSPNSNREHRANDALHSIEGSFKTLSPALLFEDETLDSTYGYSDHNLKRPQKQKSGVECEIEMRLRRSKRRILPSARFKQADQESACEGLDLAELEAIKRDNLRLTLRSQKDSCENVTNPSRANESLPSGTDEQSDLSLINFDSRLGAIVCSCKDVIDTHREQNNYNDNNKERKVDQYYCTCASISSISSINIDDSEKEEKLKVEPARGCRNNGGEDCYDEEVEFHSSMNLRRASSQPNLVDYSAKSDINPLSAVGICLQPSRFDTQSNRPYQGEVNNNTKHLLLPDDELTSKKEENTETTSDTRSGVTLNISELEKLCGELTGLHRSSEVSLFEKLDESRKQVSTNDDDIFENESSNVLETNKEFIQGPKARNCARLKSLDRKHAYEMEWTDRQCKVADVGGVTVKPDNAEKVERAIESALDENYAEQQSSLMGKANQQQKFALTEPKKSLRKNQDRRILRNNLFDDSSCRCASNSSSSSRKSQIENRYSLYQEIPPLIGEIGRAISPDCDEYKTQQDSSRVQNRATSDETSLGIKIARDSKDDVRRRQQQRREDIMRSLTDKSNLWQGLMAGGQHKGERMESLSYCQEVLEPQMGRLMLDSRLNNEDNVYACPNENLISYQEECLNNFWTHRMAQDQANARAALREKESDLFAEQINHLKMVADGREVGIDCGLVRYESVDQNYEVKCGKRVQNRRPKRSIFSKIVQLLSPTSSSNSKQEDTHTSRVWMMPIERKTNASGRLINGSQQISNPSLGRSRTLSSKSTQNLFNNSMRFISSSKKSINLTTLKSPETDYGDSFFGGRSFMSGFLTIGRRSGAATAAALVSNQKGYTFSSKSGKIFKENQLPNTLRRIYSSVDSLPSADSGLSCSNPPNFNSCDENSCANQVHEFRSRPQGNIYSQAPDSHESGHNNHIYNEPLVMDNHDAGSNNNIKKLQVVGKARAIVDCNPCAYDNEALVFKKGDIIDIIERHQSGTWIGRCANQIGHFKFINVVEISSDETNNNDEEINIKSGTESGKTITKIESNLESNIEFEDDTKEIYITKLEIKNQNSSDQSKKKSTSMHTLNCAPEKERGTGNQLGNETIMGSLEQLIAAIGLLDCRKSSCPRENEKGVASNDDQSYLKVKLAPNPTSEEGELSYLQLLNRNGICSLDTFSSIEQCSDLSRIGIIDDEHQQRLLMAAKIIRQALNAARSNFVESCSSKTKNSPERGAKPDEHENSEPDIKHHNDNRYSNYMPARVDELTSDCAGFSEPVLAKGDQLHQKTMPIKGTVFDNKEREGEPIYVNLQSSIVAEPSVGCSLIEQEKTSASTYKTSIGDLKMTNTTTCNQELRSKATDNEKARVVEHGYHDQNERKAIINRKHEIRVKLASAQDHAGQMVRVHPPIKQGRTIRRGDELNPAETSADWVDNRNSINMADQYQIHHGLGRNLSNDSDSTQGDMDHIERYKPTTAEYRPLMITEQVANEQVSSVKHGRAAFTRGCSVRVSSRKPKKINSRLASINPRDPKRRSHGWQSAQTDWQHNALSPAHRSFQHHRHERQSVVRQCEQETILLHERASKHSSNLLMNGEYKCMNLNEPMHVGASCQDKSRENTSRQQNKNQDACQNSYYLLNPDSQIMSSKSAYDIRVNFSKFLEI